MVCGLARCQALSFKTRGVAQCQQLWGVACFNALKSCLFSAFTFLHCFFSLVATGFFQIFWVASSNCSFIRMFCTLFLNVTEHIFLCMPKENLSGQLFGLFLCTDTKDSRLYRGTIKENHDRSFVRANMPLRYTFQIGRSRRRLLHKVNQKGRNGLATKGSTHFQNTKLVGSCIDYSLYRFTDR